MARKAAQKTAKSIELPPRSGAADLPRALTEAGLAFARVAVRSLTLRAGVVEETEDVRLEMFAVRRQRWGAPDVGLMEDVGDDWFNS